MKTTRKGRIKAKCKKSSKLRSTGVSQEVLGVRQKKNKSRQGEIA
jgi:hypothetical protein